MRNIWRVVALLNRKEQLRLIPLVLGVILMGLMQVVGVGSIGPFIAVLSDPTVVERQHQLRSVYEWLGLTSHWSFVVVVGAGVVAIMVLDAAIRIVVNYGIYRYVGNRRYTLGRRLFRQYLYQPYPFFLTQNTTELSKNLLSEVDKVVSNVLKPGLKLIAETFSAVAIAVFLLVLNPVIALAALAVFGSLYGGFYLFIRPTIRKFGKELRESNRIRYKASSESFGAIKDVKILGKEPHFVNMYGEGALRYAKVQATKQMLSSLPMHAVKPIIMGFAIGVTLILAGGETDVVSILPLLAVYAVSVQRLMPHIKHIFSEGAKLRYYGDMVDSFVNDMTRLPIAPEVQSRKAAKAVLHRMRFDREVELRQVEFNYPTSSELVLRGIDLTIRKNTTVGLVGATGCGKTTLVDIIMRLLEPTGGQMLVDGTEIENTGQWQRNFGYVPQHIYLSDDTVGANIAFGVPTDEVNVEAVEHAARVANLHNFVTTELPDGYETKVGERGIRFSGGQRQRVGIARALYNDPDILVMDEATSALDTLTEDAVMDAIHNLMHTKTIILIAHRITTVRECDQIYLLEKGHVTASGTYDSLLESNALFRNLAKV